MTAQKRSETILSVPISITAMSRDTLDREGIKDLNDIARNTPSLNISSNNGLGYSNVSIRGITSATGAATTGVYIDDTPIQERNDSLGPRWPRRSSTSTASRFCAGRKARCRCRIRGWHDPLHHSRPQLHQSDPALACGSSLHGHGCAHLRSRPGRRRAAHREPVGFSRQCLVPQPGRLPGPGFPLYRGGARSQLQWQLHPGGAPGGGLAAARRADRHAVHLLPTCSHGERGPLWEERPRFQSEAKVPQPNDDKWTLPTLTVDYALPAFSIRSISSYMSRTNLQVNDWSYIEPSQLQGGPVDVPGLPDWSAAMHGRIQQDVFTQEVRFTSADSAQGRLSWVGGLYFQHNRLHRVRSEFEDLDALTGAIFGAPALAIFGSAPLPGPVGYAENTDQHRAGDRRVRQCVLQAHRAAEGDPRCPRGPQQVHRQQLPGWPLERGPEPGTRRAEGDPGDAEGERHL